VAGYVVVRTGGKKGTTRDIDITEAPDGRTRVKIHERVEYLNPFGSLSRLLKRVIGAGETGSS
jgi:vacuolar-type H+-ATPase subunit B/Vma2